MKLTCLNTGSGYHFPACYLLQLCGVRVLLECPLDVSFLRFFAPASFAYLRRQYPSNGSLKSKQLEKDHLKSLIVAEPWYKTADLQMVDPASIDLVLISSPVGFLGLPYLTRNPNFSARIYATEAAAKLGHLMMNELVELHVEFIRLYGPRCCTEPSWSGYDELKVEPQRLKESMPGVLGVEIRSWHYLYSALDVKACMQQVILLHFAEEMSYNDKLLVKPVSSGLEIGASNWILSSSTRSVAYVTNALPVSGHAMHLDIHSLMDADEILFSDFSFLIEMGTFEKHVSNEDYPFSEVKESLRFRYKFPVYTQCPSFASISDIKNSLGVCNSNEGQEMALFCSSSKEPTCIQPSTAIIDHSSSKKDQDQIRYICNSIVKAIKRGGSVLIPIPSHVGCTLQLLEEISYALNSTELRETPIFFISSRAEETLAFSNTIPEWLCKQRQEKFYAGEPLFGHANFILEKKLHLSSALHSQCLVDVWQEPCIVFAGHWSLRVGPVVHLLNQWSQNEKHLLITTEPMIDIEDSLSPYKPMAMELLHFPFLAGLRSNGIHELIKKLQPKLVLLPKSIEKWVCMWIVENQLVYFYSNGETLQIPNQKDHIKVAMSTDLAFHLRPKQAGSLKSVANFKGELHVSKGNYLLRSSTASDELPFSTLHVGGDPKALLMALGNKGICGSIEPNIEEGIENNEDRVQFNVKVTSPSSALIEIRGSHAVIKANSFDTCGYLSRALRDIKYDGQHR